MITVYENIRQCLTLQGARKKSGRKPSVKDLGVVEDAVVVVDEGTIRWVGARDKLPSEFAKNKRESAKHPVWLPALVECHTHLVYGGNRYHDYALRCSGKTYQEIAKSGGGILSTVKATRESTVAELNDRAAKELAIFESSGVGCLEIKSGYGLSLESEIRILESIQKLRARTSIELVATFLPAHAVPPEFKGDADAFVQEICDSWIPEIARRNLADFFDAFVEKGYFTVKQTRKMCEVAAAHGLKIKLHVDQFTDQKATALGVEVAATSCDHLDSVSATGIRKIAQSETVAVLAPGASVFTGTPLPPARKLIDAGAIVALTTDFNPGTCPSHNLPLMMTLGCSMMRMTIPEVIVACTYNAARALNRQNAFGTIEAGRPFRVWQAPVETYEAIPYRFGEC